MDERHLSLLPDTSLNSPTPSKIDDIDNIPDDQTLQERAATFYVGVKDNTRWISPSVRASSKSLKNSRDPQMRRNRKPQTPAP